MVTPHYASSDKYLTAKSTDTKPTVGVSDGMPLLETDTGDVFFFDEETQQWLQP